MKILTNCKIDSDWRQIWCAAVGVFSTDAQTELTFK